MAELGSNNGSGYPAVIDVDNSREINAPNPNKTLARAAVFNDVNDAIIKIETELGTDPAGSLTNMKTFMQTEHNPSGTHNIGIWKLQERKEVTVAAQSVTISGLDGNTDILYWLFVRVVGGGALSSYYLRPNNDTTAANYGYQYVAGQDVGAYAVRSTSVNGLHLGIAQSGSRLLFKGLLYAKSGYVRTLNGEASDNVFGTTTIDRAIKIDSVWNNTADNITSLVVYADVANGLGIGTAIELWRRT